MSSAKLSPGQRVSLPLWSGALPTECEITAGFEFASEVWVYRLRRLSDDTDGWLATERMILEHMGGAVGIPQREPPANKETRGD